MARLGSAPGTKLKPPQFPALLASEHVAPPPVDASPASSPASPLTGVDPPTQTGWPASIPPSGKPFGGGSQKNTKPPRSGSVVDVQSAARNVLPPLTSKDEGGAGP